MTRRNVALCQFVTPPPLPAPISRFRSLMDVRQIVYDLKQPILPTVTSPYAYFPIHNILFHGYIYLNINYTHYSDIRCL